MRIVKKGKTVEKLLKNMQSTFEVEVGHFEDQGKHSSGYTYPELMAFHHKEGGFDNAHVPPRPIKDITEFRVDNKSKFIFSGIETVFKSGRDPKALKQYLDKVGQKIKDVEQDVFGDSILIKNADATIELKGRDEPMVDTGELKSKVEVRVKKK